MNNIIYSDPLELKGWIASIKRFMLHDGPGIRTVIFMRRW